MKNDSFLRYINNSRDCEPSLLDSAVNRGLTRIKNEQPDVKKIYMLAAVGIFAAALLFSVNLTPHKPLVEIYYGLRPNNISKNSEALGSYFTDMAVNIRKFSGGK